MMATMGSVQPWSFCSKRRMLELMPVLGTVQLRGAIDDWPFYSKHKVPRLLHSEGPSASPPSSTSTGSNSDGASVPDLALHLAPRLATQLNCDHAMARAQPRFCIQRGFSGSSPSSTSTSSKRLGPHTLQHRGAPPGALAQRNRGKPKATHHQGEADPEGNRPPPLCDEKGCNTTSR